MQQVDILTNFPTTLSCIILRDWLNLKCVVATDSAYCSTLLRKYFLSILQSEEYFVREETKIPVKDDLYGLFPFGSKFRNVFLRRELISEQDQAIAEHFHDLTHIQLQFPRGCTSEVRNILNANLLLESLTIFEDKSFVSFSSVLSFEAMQHPSFNGIMLPKLNTLRLTGAGSENGHIAEALKMSSKIVRLDLNGFRLKDITLSQIGQLCPHLRCLGLASACLSDKKMEQITNSCVNLIHLNVEDQFDEFGRTNLSDKGILTAVRSWPDLRSLNIRYNSAFTDKCLMYIYTHCATTLHTLHICGASYQKQFTHNGLEQVLIHCTQLRTLCWSEWLPSEGRRAFNYCTLRNLTCLGMKNSLVDARDVKNIAQHAVNLQQIWICFASDYTYTDNGDLVECNGLEHFVTGFPKLRELYLVDWDHYVCEAALDALKAARSELKVYVNVEPTKPLSYDLLNMDM